MQTLSRLVQTPLLAALFIISVVGVQAQNTPNQPTPSPTPAVTAQPAPSPAPTVDDSKPQVIEVDGNLQLDDIVEVKVKNLDKWVEAAEANDASKLVPYINGRAIRGNYPDELHLESGRLIYHLEITPDNKKVWTDLLGAPKSMREPATLSVGLEDGSAFKSLHGRGEQPVILTVISPVYGLVALAVILTTLALLLWLVRKTNIIREPGPPPAPGRRRPW